MIVSRWIIFFEICIIISLRIIFLIKIQYRNTSIMPAIFNTPFNQVTYIKLQRKRILQQMDNFEYPSGRFEIHAEKLTDLTPETGGTPVRSIIISTWRSGTTFLGDILCAMPGNYYHFEPLLPFGVTQIHGPPNDTKAIRNIKKLLNCDYSDMNEYLKFGKDNFFLFSRNYPLWRGCKQYPPFCYEPDSLTAFCKLFPLQTMKTARLRLPLAEQLLDDTSLNVRILLLVRDPRGTMQSRKQLEWCTGKKECDDASYLCDDLVSEYYLSEILFKKYPSRFRVVRYEDLSVNPYNMSRDILQFYGLPFHHKVEKFLDDHTKIDRGTVGSTFRNSKTAPFHWIKDLQRFQIEEIEKSCSKAMDLWGYRKIISLKEQTDAFDPVLPAPFTWILNSSQ